MGKKNKTTHLITPENPLRFGVIGIGYWGPNILRNISELREASLKIICDKIPERREMAKRRYPSATLTDNANDIFSNPTIDAVAIATPVSTHFDLAKQALLAGKHVFIEKPLTDSKAKAEELTALAKKKGLTLMVDHVFIYSAPVQKIKQIINSGDVGDLLYFDSVRINLGLFQRDVNVIWDLAPHDLSIMDYLLGGNPTSISAIAVKHFPGGQHEDMAYIIVKYPKNLIAHFHVNWVAPVKIRSVIIGGSKKMIVYDDTNPAEKIKVYDKGVNALKAQKQVEYRTGDMWAPQIESGEALRGALLHFIECINKKKSPLSDGKAGTRVVHLLEKANLSAKQNGKEIKL